MWKYKNNNLEILCVPTSQSGPNKTFSPAKIHALGLEGKNHGVEKQNIFVVILNLYFTK